MKMEIAREVVGPYTDFVHENHQIERYYRSMEIQNQNDHESHQKGKGKYFH